MSFGRSVRKGLDGSLITGRLAGGSRAIQRCSGSSMVRRLTLPLSTSSGCVESLAACGIGCRPALCVTILMLTSALERGPPERRRSAFSARHERIAARPLAAYRLLASSRDHIHPSLAWRRRRPRQENRPPGALSATELLHLSKGGRRLRAGGAVGLQVSSGSPFSLPGRLSPARRLRQGRHHAASRLSDGRQRIYRQVRARL